MSEVKEICQIQIQWQLVRTIFHHYNIKLDKYIDGIDVVLHLLLDLLKYSMYCKYNNTATIMPIIYQIQSSTSFYITVLVAVYKMIFHSHTQALTLLPSLFALC